MTAITRAEEKDAALLSQIATQTFIESHGHSAPPEDIDAYIAEKYSIAAFEKELQDKKNIYHLIYHDEQIAGYSKIIFNSPYPGAATKNIRKLDRIYLLSGFYNLFLGKSLFEFNVELAKQNQQAGLWLFVWKENPRAVHFYTKNGFVIIGSYDFKISKGHSNPNHQMLLLF